MPASPAQVALAASLLIVACAGVRAGPGCVAREL